MKTIIPALVFLFCSVMTGCATVAGPACVEPAPSGNVYPAATGASRQALADDLRSGKIAVGSSLETIRKAYGEPDTMFVLPCNVRATYTMSPMKRISIWFDDGQHMSMWAD
ncbi:MAG TPA: hypothetical protein PKL77_04090 [Candidatus Omnitrophota bacterium]|nr:hypothetical protein [Candidatus Omnitrophota bacterium]HPT07818.1 hypothetical protein [Candidatus Omnitrophota bacterium]